MRAFISSGAHSLTIGRGKALQLPSNDNVWSMQDQSIREAARILAETEHGTLGPVHPDGINGCNGERCGCAPLAESLARFIASEVQ